MKYLTLMVIPYPGADVKSLRLSHRTLKVMAVLLALLFCAAVVAVLYLKPIYMKARQYETLLAKNRELTLENEKIMELADKMKRIDKLVAQIQMAQGVKSAEELDGQLDGPSGLKDAATYVQDDTTELSGELLFPPELSAENQASGVPRGQPVLEKTFVSRSFSPEIFHFGVDFALKQGTPVRATADGVVTVAEKNENLGYYLKIRHPNGYRTMYAHNSQNLVKKGMRVKKGDIIAYTGNTGISSGPHLHYAIFDEKNNPIDPLPFLNE